MILHTAASAKRVASFILPDPTSLTLRFEQLHYSIAYYERNVDTNSIRPRRPCCRCVSSSVKMHMEVRSVHDARQLGASLICAAEEDDIQSIRKLLQQRADINATDEFFHTALILASGYGHTDIAICARSPYSI